MGCSALPGAGTERTLGVAGEALHRPPVEPGVTEHVDVVVVGAGISGVSAAHHLQERCPDRSYVVLEGRERIGGTWDLFRYPGVRSDSDMHTLGFGFRPWTGPRSIADGPAIRDYVEGTAREEGITDHVRFLHRVVAAEWSTPDGRWTVTVETGPERTPAQLTCNFLWMCAGYYDYERGHLPDWDGTDDFSGELVHPQFWPEDLDVDGKRVLVIGSGATAVTLVPALAERGAQVSMLQRSPTYVVAQPSVDPVATWLRGHLPARVAHTLTRWKNILVSQLVYWLTRWRPEMMKRYFVDQVRELLGPGHDVETHFTPSYDPWDQRLCLAPDADLFAAIRSGHASVVTATIDRFVPDGVRLDDGRTLEADVVVTATGLELQVMGGIALRVDGELVDPSRSFTHRGMMFSDIPNLAATVGYANASWTLRADLTSAQVCRVLNTMRRRGMQQCTPRVEDDLRPQPLLALTSGYVTRAADRLPKQGDGDPWRMHQSYTRDWLTMRLGSIDDQLVFSNPDPSATDLRTRSDSSPVRG
jgi:monooxygenase